MRISRALSPAGAAVLGLLLLAPAALAADGERTPLNLSDPKSPATSSAGSGGLVRTIVGLAVVLGVEERATGTGLRALATLPLGANRSLQLVRAGTEVVLVGIAEHGVTPIRTYSEQEARTLGLLADEEEPLPEAPPAPYRGFGALMNELRRRTVIR
jgi:flagellar protein FliO/FliZ